MLAVDGVDALAQARQLYVFGWRHIGTTDSVRSVARVGRRSSESGRIDVCRLSRPRCSIESLARTKLAQAGSDSALRS
jgi:hypothetical protein